MHTWLASVVASEPAQFLLDNVADAVIAVDAELNIRYWNQAAESIYGWQAADVLGRSSAEILKVIRYLDGSESAHVLQIVSAEGVWRGEVVQRHRSGCSLIIDAAIHLLRNPAGETIGMVGVNRDVTTRHKLEEGYQAALAEAEQAYKVAREHARWAEESRALAESLIDAAPVGFAFLDRNLHFQMVNERFAACNGTSVAAHLGRTSREVVPVIADALEGLVQQVLTTGEPIIDLPISGEGFGPPWEGKHWLETFYPVSTPGGQLLGVGVTSVEVTELKRLGLDLARSRMQLAGIIDSAMDAIITVDERQQIVLFNQAAERLFGVHAADVIGTALDRFIPAAHRESHRAFIKAFGRTGAPAGYRENPQAQMMALRADGTTFPVETSISHLSLNDATLYTVILRDVSERVAAEQQLRASEANLRAVFDNTAQSFILLDQEHRLVLWNRLAYERALAVNGKALAAGASILEYSVPALVPAMRESLARAARGEPVHVEYCLGTAERPLWLSFDYIPVRDGSGAMLGTCITTLDITDQREALAALSRSEERFRALVAGTSDTIALLDGEMCLRYASPAWERTLGYPVAAWLGRSPFDLIHPDDVQEARRGLAALLRGEPEPRQVTVRLRHRDESWVWAEVGGSDLRDHPAVEGIVLTIRDVTERKRLAAQLIQAQRMDSIGRLAGGIAHDFNNLLTALTGYIELALDSLPADSPIREDIVEAQRAAERGSGLTRQLLAFARRQTIAPEPCALNDLIGDMERLLRRLIGADIALVTRLAPDVGVVVVEPSQIEQVLVNLAVNARDAMPDGGTLSVETARVHLDAAAARRLPTLRPGTYVRVTVSDTGVGMDEHVREHLFEPFFTTKGKKGGTGLGLATCYGIVAQHGGAIDVISQPGAGATFQIYLPQSPTPAPTAIATSTRPLRDGSETVLVVEDDAAVRMLAVRVLRQHGYTVCEASDGQEALDVLAQGCTVNLVLSDVVMPRLGGRELLTRLHLEHPDLPVVCMSGYTNDGGLTEKLRSGRGGFIQKPFTSGTLLRVVREVLDLAAPGRLPAAGTPPFTRIHK
jgi:PAS domain S-box-containing protein